MKKTLSLFLTGIIFLLAPLSAQSAEDIIRRADKALQGPRLYSVSSLTIHRGDDVQPPQVMEGFGMEIDGKYHSLTVYREPARMRGTAYLMAGDDLWVRFSTTGRVRKLSSSARKNSAGGSDLSYADMGEGNQGIGSKYQAVLRGRTRLEGQECFEVELTPRRGSAAPYEKVVATISVEEYRYLQIEYFEAGARIKTMALGNYRTVDDTAYPFRMEMVSHTRDSRTVIETTTVELDSPRVEPRLFTTAYLESLR